MYNTHNPSYVRKKKGREGRKRVEETGKQREEREGADEKWEKGGDGTRCIGMLSSIRPFQH